MSTANTQIYSTYQLPAAYLPVHGIGYSTHDIVTEDVLFEPSRKGVQYVDAECGRGKTFSTCEWIKQWKGMLNHMYVAPTTALLEQTSAQLDKLRLPHKIISHKNVTGSVGKEVIEHLKKCRRSGNIFLITWSAYMDLRYFHRRENWAIYIDEIPQVDNFYEPPLPFNSQFLADYLSLGDPVNETLSKVTVHNKSGLERHLQKDIWRDAAYEPFYDILSDALSEAKDLFVDTDTWNRVVERGVISQSVDKNRIFFISMLKPSLFQGATILGANIKNSMLYAWLTGYHGVDFHEHSDISKNLLPLMDLKGRARISYFSHYRWTKSQRDRVPDWTDETIIAQMENEIVKLTDGRDYLLVANKDYKGKLSVKRNAVRIPVVSKGMNEFTDHNMIVHLPALNRKTKNINMLNQLGICSETISQSTAYETLYQNVMRTALRLPDSDEVVDIIVPSKAEADFLVGMFGSAEVKKVGDIKFKNFKPLTQVQRNNSSASKRTTKRLTSIGENIVKNGYVFSYSIKEKSNQKWQISKEVSGYFISLSKSFKNNHVDDYLITHFQTIEDLVCDLKLWSKNPVKDKKEAPTILSGIYDPEDATKWKTKEGFITASMMILDFDSGSVSPEIFENIFWNNCHKSARRAFILVNTFSRTPDNPNRFRVFMPFKQHVKNLEEYQAVYDSIVHRLAVNGHPSDKIGDSEKTKSGIDDTARTGAQEFYAPCTNRQFPESRLFNAKGCNEKEIGRYAIDTEGHGRTALKPASKMIAVPVDGYGEMDEETRQAKIADIKRTYLAIPKGLAQGLRNHGFYQAAWDMADLMTLPEVEAVLVELAAGEKKMLDRVADKIQSVRRNKYN